MREVSSRNRECLELLKNVKDQLQKKEGKKKEQRSLKKNDRKTVRKKSKHLLWNFFYIKFNWFLYIFPIFSIFISSS